METELQLAAKAFLSQIEALPEDSPERKALEPYMDGIRADAGLNEKENA